MSLWEEREKRWNREGANIFEYLKRAQPVNSFCGFTKLRRLVVPRQAIFKYNKPEGMDGKTTLQLSLASLKTLEITSTNLNTLACLRDSIPTVKSSDLPELEEIILHDGVPFDPDVDTSALLSVGVSLKQGRVYGDYTHLD